MAEAGRGEVSQYLAQPGPRRAVSHQPWAGQLRLPLARGEGLSQAQSGKGRRMRDFPRCTMEARVSRAQQPPVAGGWAEASAPGVAWVLPAAAAHPWAPSPE